MPRKHSTSVITGIGLSVALVATAAPASARWSVHDGSLATRLQSAPGAAEREVCKARVRAQTGWVSFDEHPEDYVPPVESGAYARVRYGVYLAPPGFSGSSSALSRFDDTSGSFLGVYFLDENGVEHDAVELGRVASPPRELLRPRQQVEPDNPAFVYTQASLYYDLPGSVQLGDVLAIAAIDAADPMPRTLTAVSCAFSTPGHNAKARAGKRVKRTVGFISGPGAPRDYKATIAWGDGSPRTTGTIRRSGARLAVAGTHRFAKRGRYTVQVRVKQEYTGIVHRSTARMTVRPRA